MGRHGAHASNRWSAVVRVPYSVAQDAARSRSG